MLRMSTPRSTRWVAKEPSGGGSREIDCDEGAALERSGRVKEPEEATESILLEADHPTQPFFKFGFHLVAHKLLQYPIFERYPTFFLPEYGIGG